MFQFAAVQQTSTVKLLAFSLKKIKRQFNKTKLTAGNAFIVNHFALRGKKEPKCVERTFLWSSLGSVDLPLSPQSMNGAYMPFFQIILYLDVFFAHFVFLLEVEIKLIIVTLRLPIFKPLHALQIIQLYKHMTSAQERAIIVNDCQQIGNLQAVPAGKKDLPPLELFYDIDTLLGIPIGLKDTQMNKEI